MANEIVEKLRALAISVIELGDSRVELEAQLNGMEEVMAQEASCEEELQAWREAIEDHRRGLVDQSELFERTIDRG